MPKNLAIVSIVVPVILALFNTSLFGYQGLTSYFGFTIFALVAFLLNVYKGDEILIPLPVVVFSGLVIYVSLHGIVLRNFNLTNYYWICSLAFLLAIAMNKKNKIFVPAIFSILSYAAAIESLIVLMQWIKLLPSKNAFFSCTGTWQNPNVTAMFLSMCMYAVFQKLREEKNKPLFYFILSTLALSVVALQCRTAIIVTLLFVAGHFANKKILNNVERRHRSYFKTVAAIVGVVVFFSALLALKFKTASTFGRLNVWKNSIQLILQKPICGYGIGMFEKEYNFFIAQHSNPSNDYVNMPYNDFLEFGVEGGIIAMLLWLCFIVSVGYYRYKNKYSLLPVIAFLIIELTNFGFQAIPVFALFLLYCLLPNESGLDGEQKKGDEKNKKTSRCNCHSQTILFTPGSISKFCTGTLVLVLFMHQGIYAFDLYHLARVDDGFSNATEAIEEYKSLPSLIKDNELYQTKYATACLQTKQYREAVAHYKLAMNMSSRPYLWGRAGYCYQQLGKYDSSYYYYHLCYNLQPYMLTPRFALMNLYLQKGDSASAKKMAQEIVDLPLKVEGKETEYIKKYAVRFMVSTGDSSRKLSD